MCISASVSKISVLWLCYNWYYVKCQIRSILWSNIADFEYVLSLSIFLCFIEMFGTLANNSYVVPRLSWWLCIIFIAFTEPRWNVDQAHVNQHLRCRWRSNEGPQGHGLMIFMHFLLAILHSCSENLMISIHHSYQSWPLLFPVLSHQYLLSIW